jgi:LysR family transcriptional activator of dmlA
MPSPIQPADVSFFAEVATSASLSSAARELGITTAAVSKRLLQLEGRLGFPLLSRTTRRMNLTPEGELFLDKARRILSDVDDLNQLMSQEKDAPRGLLRVNATLGFGRMHVAPVIARFSAQYPGVDVQLQLSASPPPLSDDSFDVCVRFGEPPDARVIARRLAPNRRLLCAAPQYLALRGNPILPHELSRHNCIVIRQGDESYGVWRLSTGRGPNHQTEVVKVSGNLSSNDGEIAVNWALVGLGIVMRAEFDVQRYLNSGRLVQVLPHYDTPGADIYAVYPQRHQLTTRVKKFVDFLSGTIGG